VELGKAGVHKGQSILSYQPRRPVPWQAIDLLLVIAFYILAQSSVVSLAKVVLGPDVARQHAVSGASPSNSAHVVVRLMGEKDPWILMLCIISAVIVAPAVEEFMFRILLQGWLESVGRRWRRKMPTLRRMIPRAIGPIFLSSLLFASLHFRGKTPQLDMQYLIFLFAAGSMASMLTLAFAIVLLRWRVGATAVDLGWVPAKLLGDIGLGLVMFAVIVPPIYAIQYFLASTMPEDLAPDPIPLFFLALVLGFLCFRTHRIMPAIVVHAALNATSLMLSLAGGQ